MMEQEAKTDNAVASNPDLQHKPITTIQHQPSNSISTDSAEVFFCKRTSLFTASSGSVLKTIDDASASLQSMDTGSKLWSTPRHNNGTAQTYQFDHDADTPHSHDHSPVIVNHSDDIDDMHSFDDAAHFDANEIQSNNDSMYSSEAIDTLPAQTQTHLPHDHEHDVDDAIATPVPTDATVDAEEPVAIALAAEYGIPNVNMAQDKARESLEFLDDHDPADPTEHKHKHKHEDEHKHVDIDRGQTERQTFQTMDAVVRPGFRRNSSEKTCVYHDDGDAERDANEMSSSSSSASQNTCLVRDTIEEEDEDDGMDDIYGHERTATADHEYDDSFDDEKLNTHTRVHNDIKPPRIEKNTSGNASASVMLEMIGSPNVAPVIVPNMQQSQQDLDERFFIEMHSRKAAQIPGPDIDEGREKHTLSYQKLQRFGQRASTNTTQFSSTSVAAGKSLSRDRTQSQPFAMAREDDHRWLHAKGPTGADAPLMNTLSEYSTGEIEGVDVDVDDGDGGAGDEYGSGHLAHAHTQNLQKMKYRLIVGAVCCVTLLIGYVVYTKNSKVVIGGYARGRADAPMIPSRRARAPAFHR